MLYRVVILYCNVYYNVISSAITLYDRLYGLVAYLYQGTFERVVHIDILFECTHVQVVFLMTY